LTIPNYITIFRVLLVPVFFTVLVSYTPEKEVLRWVALTLFAIASFTDALDGFLARVTHKQTNFGRFLDPLADKLLLLSGFIGLLFVNGFLYHPPLWITVTIVFRDMFIVMGLITIYLATGDIRIQPNLLGKATTAFQMATLIAILMNIKLAIPLCYVTAVLTILSCLVYIIREIRRMNSGMV